MNDRANPTSSTLDSLARRLGINQFDLTEIIAAPTPDAACWCHHEVNALDVAPPALEPLQRLSDRLQFAFPTRTEGHAWLQIPSDSLGGQTPMDALRAGDIERVIQSLETSRVPA